MFIPDLKFMGNCSNKTAENPNENLFNTNKNCEIVHESAICLTDDDQIILQDTSPKGLVGFGLLMKNSQLDNSINTNHINGTVNYGPGISGLGASAKFENKTDPVEVPMFPIIEDFSSTGTGTGNENNKANIAAQAAPRRR